MAFFEHKLERSPDMKSGTLASYRSAMSYYFKHMTEEAKAQGGKWDDSAYDMLKDHLKGLRNISAERVREGKASGEVGMKALALDDYRRISQFTLKLARHQTTADKVSGVLPVYDCMI